MMQRNKVIYTPVAVDDMDEIFSYIAQDNISVAENILETFPEMGSKLSDEDYKLVQRGYRFIVIHPYMVFYQKINTVIINRDCSHQTQEKAYSTIEYAFSFPIEKGVRKIFRFKSQTVEPDEP